MNVAKARQVVQNASRYEESDFAENAQGETKQSFATNQNMNRFNNSQMFEPVYIR